MSMAPLVLFFLWLFQRPQIGIIWPLKSPRTFLLLIVLYPILEEIVFRGLVFRTFYTAFRPWVAITLSSLFFAILHFKAPSESIPGNVSLGDSIRVAAETATALVTQFNAPYLLTLFLVGVVLHQAFLLKRNLWASVSLHAGWVFAIKLIGPAFSDGDNANAFSGSIRLVDGYWVCLVLAAAAGLFAWLLHRSA